MQVVITAVVAIASIVLFGAGIFFFAVAFRLFKIWIQAVASGAHINYSTLFGMWIRKVNPFIIVQSRIMAVKAGLDIPADALEAHYLAGGNVFNVVKAVISAEKATIPLSFSRATMIDLAGRDVRDAIETSVNPMVIDCPDPNKGRETIDAVAMDGIQLKVRARVTVRANLEKLVGGAKEQTIIARVGEGIVTTIGSAVTHKQVLENPDSISKKVLEKGLDSGTAFEILSIDIADIDVGENVGARLQTDQAEADKKIAQARAEGRRAIAVAAEQEMKAKAQEMRAKVIEAEAEIPKAISESFRSGHLGIMDFYRMKNIQSDTRMRDNISGQGPEQPK